MAHTNSTANYELSQFLGTDKPAWLVDYNGDMLKIDTALKANADAEAASAEDIQELQDAIGSAGLTGRITAIENDIGDIKTEIGVVPLPTTAQSLTGAIAELKGVNDDQTTAIGLNATNIAQVGGAVDGVTRLAYTIANVYDSTATYAVGDYAIYQNTLYKCTTAINVGESFDPAKWTSVKVMSEVGQGGGGSSYSAGDGIDITNNVISFDGSTADYNNTVSGLAATNIQAAIDEIAAGGSTTRTLLWSNPNPTSTFAAQNITLSSDNYDELIWYVKTVNDIDKMITSRSLKGFGTIISNVFGTTLRSRDVTMNSDTSFSIADAHEGSTTANNRLIPYAVYGIKY